MHSAHNSQLDAVLSRLSGVKRGGRGYTARCPAHSDKENSLSIREVDGKILLNCFACCEFGAIVEALGMTAADMFPEERPTAVQKAERVRTTVTLEELAKHKKLSAVFLRSIGWKDATGIHGAYVEIPYVRRDGSLQRTRIRTALSAKEGSRWSPGETMIAYEPDRGVLAKQERYAFVVEGETDVVTLLAAGFPAIGIPGASATKVIDAEHVDGLERVYVVQETDAAGERFVADTQSRLKELGFEGAVHVFRCPDSAKDPSALYQRDRESFSAKMNAEMEACRRRDSKEAVEWRGGADIFAPLPPVPWRVRGLQICPGRPTIFGGFGSSAKTLSAQSMALCAAAGLDVWGFFSTAPMQVRHFDYEQGWYATARRYQRLAVGHGIDPRMVADRLKTAIFPSVFLDQPNAIEAYTKLCDGVELCILDALRGATPTQDENDSRIRPCLDNLTRVSEKTGCAFVVIHHAGKPKDSHSDSRMVLRGSSAIFDACGSVFIIAQGDTKDAPRKVTHSKPPAEAEGMGVEDFALRVEDVEHQGNPTGGVRVLLEQLHQSTPAELALSKSDERRALVLELVRSRPGMSKSAICDAAKMQKQAGIDLFRELAAEGLVDIVRTGNADKVYPVVSQRKPYGSTY